MEGLYMFLNLLRVNLQFFSADGGADGGNGGDPAPKDDYAGGDDDKGTGDPKKPEDKTFKQEDVNNIVAKETKKAQEKLLKQLGIEDFDNAKEGFEKFKEWQESQKTETEKQQEQLQNLTKDKENLTSENANLKAQLSALKQNVKADSVEDVVALAERMVDDETTIDEAIKQVVEKYPHFADSTEEKQQDKPTFSTGQHQTNGNSSNDPFAAKLAKYN